MRRCLLIAVSLLTIVGFCENADTVKVRGKGIGVTKMEALKDAYRDAVEQAVGLYVDAEQMVKNEDLVKDQILTQSNAYIESYKIAKESKSDTGLITVTILADVRKLALTRKIKGVMPTQKSELSDVSKNLHAEIVTDFKRKADAIAILKNELENLSPVKQLMKVSLASEKPVTESVPEDANLVRLWYPIRMEIDRTRYYKEFVPRWMRILDQIKTAPAKRLSLKNELSLIKAYNAFADEEYGNKRKDKSGVMTRCEDKREDDSWVFHKDVYPLAKSGLALNEEYQGMCFLSTLVDGEAHIFHGFGRCDYYKFTGKIKDDNREAFRKMERFVRRIFIQGENSNFGPIKTMPENCNFNIALVKSARGNTLSGSIYKVSYECVSEIVKWQNKFILGNGKVDYDNTTFEKTTYDLCFLDAKGEEIIGTTFAVKNIDISNLACVVLDEGKYPDHAGARMWLLTPLVGGVTKSYVKWVCIDVPKDDVAKIATASISVEE